MRYDCVGLGIMVYDELALMDRFPRPNSKNRLNALAHQGGGPVATALATCAKLGKTCAMVSALGSDANGDFLCKELADFGVETRHILRLVDVATPKAVILVDQSTGERTVLLHQDKACTVNNLDDSYPFDRCRVLHVDGHYPEADIFAAKIARQQGALVSLDIGSQRPVSSALLELTDIAIVSKTYSDHYLTANNACKSAEQLYKSGMKIAGVTCDLEGSYFYDSHGAYHQPAFRVQTVDSTGAGDVFHGAAVYAVLQGFSGPQMALFAGAAAALKCLQVGGKKGIPNVQQIKNFLLARGENSDFIPQAARTE